MSLAPIVEKRFARHLIALLAGCVVGLAAGTAYADGPLPIYICTFCSTWGGEEYCASAICFGTSHTCSGEFCWNNPKVVRACCGGACPSDDGWQDTCGTAGE